MTDSPQIRVPLDPKEQPILDKLLSARTQLELLKQDRSKCIKSQDVIALYNEVIEEVAHLNEVRTTKRLEQNRGMRVGALHPRPAADKLGQWIMCSTIVSSSFRWPS